MSRLRTLARAWRYRNASPEARAAHRDRLRADLVADARSRSRFYAERYADLPPGTHDLARLPPVTKGELMARFDDWVTDPALSRADLAAFLSDPDRVGERFRGYLVTATSGSTGGRGYFVHDEEAIATYATMWTRAFRRWVRGREAARIARRGLRTARIMATGNHFPSHSYSTFNARRRFRRPQLVVPVTDPIPKQAEALAAFDPTAIVGYPMGLALLAREKAAGRLPIEPVLVISVSECLDPGARVEIERGFGVPVRNVYSAAEHFGLASDCRAGRLHVNDDVVDFEPVDDDFAPVAPGDVSTGVLITNLANRVQPAIRYLLTDAVRVDPDRCPCGSRLPAIEVFAKRRQILSWPGPDGGRIDVLPIALTTVVDRLSSVDSYQLIQTGERILSVRLAVMEGSDPESVWRAVMDGLRRTLDDLGAPAVTIERDPRPPARDPVSGKFHKVWSEAWDSSPSASSPRRGPPSPSTPTRRRSAR